MAAARRNGNRRVFTSQQLDTVAQGQQTRTVLAETQEIYISKCRVMTHILNDIVDIRADALELDLNGKPLEHIGQAQRVFIMKLPMSADHAKKLFAAISIDPSLPRKRRRRNIPEDPPADDNDDGIKQVF